MPSSFSVSAARVIADVMTVSLLAVECQSIQFETIAL
jgi:hypothetical protein